MSDNYICVLEEKEVMVFGSNRAGLHAGGAARQAHEDFGAEWGVGEGLTGRSYAFPTLDEHLQRLTINDLEDAVDKFYDCAESHPQLTFLLTKVGTGIAGYPEETMRQLFKDPPANVRKPDGW